MFAEVKSFCFCMSLAVGTKIIGFLFTVLAALSTAMYSLSVYHLMYLIKEPALVFYEIMALTSAVQLITGVLLIIGAFKKNTKLMRPWAVVSWWQSVGLVVLTLIGSFLYVTVAIEEELNDELETTVVIVSYTSYALVIYYAASVVDSYCTKLSIRRSGANYEENLIESQPVAKDVHMIRGAITQLIE